MEGSEKKMKKILVPVDGSEFSERALLKAKELADCLGSKIFLLTVSNVMISALNYQPSRLIHTQASTIDWAGLMEKTRQNSEELLEKAKESLGDLDVETILIEEPIGRVADNIVEIAKEKDVDLIVMGSNGIGSLGRRLYLGSVTNKVLHMTKKPVMVIQ
jgi:nucleotide-binding universal stress UspA family protein